MGRTLTDAAAPWLRRPVSRLCCRTNTLVEQQWIHWCDDHPHRRAALVARCSASVSDLASSATALRAPNTTNTLFNSLRITTSFCFGSFSPLRGRDTPYAVDRREGQDDRYAHPRRHRGRARLGSDRIAQGDIEGWAGGAPSEKRAVGVHSQEMQSTGYSQGEVSGSKRGRISDHVPGCHIIRAEVVRAYIACTWLRSKATCEQAAVQHVMLSIVASLDNILVWRLPSLERAQPPRLISSHSRVPAAAGCGCRGHVL